MRKIDAGKDKMKGNGWGDCCKSMTRFQMLNQLDRVAKSSTDLGADVPLFAINSSSAPDIRMREDQQTSRHQRLVWALVWIGYFRKTNPIRWLPSGLSRLKRRMEFCSQSW